jgi:hypothetical protein
MKNERRTERPSIADGFWMSLLASGPLLSLAVFPYVPRSVSTGALILCGLLGTAWVVIPSLRWAWAHLRDAREATIDLAVTQPMPRHLRAALVASAPGAMPSRYSQRR